MQKTRTRTGCRGCKARKVKCDETKPICAGCSKRSLECVWGRPLSIKFHKPQAAISNMTSPSPPPQPSLSTAIHPLALNMDNMKLLHHFILFTSHTLCDHKGNLIYFWNIPRMAISHKVLMHAVLASSAMHLRTITDDSAYDRLTAAHVLSAISGFKSMKPQIQYPLPPAHCSEPDYVSNHMLLWLCFTSSPPPPNTMFVLRWIGIARQTTLDFLSSTENSFPELPLARVINPLTPIALPQYMTFPDYLFHIHSPALHSDEEVLDFPTCVAYQNALDALHHVWKLSFNITEENSAPAVMNVWTNRLCDTFLGFLQERRQRALVILAHYCAIVVFFEKECWWMRGKARLDLVRITGMIQERWFEWLAWPLAVANVLPEGC